MRIAVLLGIVAAGAATQSCGTFEGTVPLQVFAIEGAHAELDCVACHVTGEFTPLPLDCVSCHEADRKTPEHYAGQTCNGFNGTGCHTSADFVWADAAGNINHDFLPLESTHALECIACHADPAGGNDLEGQSDYCWNCHEVDRKPEPEGHYVNPADVLDPNYRWDCAGCHLSVNGENAIPVPNWAFPFRLHEPRIPHGAVITDPNNVNACVTTPEEDWVQDCALCHQNPTPGNWGQFQCIICHTNAADDHNPEDFVDESCLDGCHASAGPQRVGVNCDSLLD